MEVSVIIPCRNELNYIDVFLKSLSSQATTFEFEMIIADGCSDDGTYERLFQLSSNYKNLVILKNDKKTVPNALNICIKRSVGRYIARLDVHSVYPNDYLQRLYNAAESLGAENVGGAWETLPGDDTLIARAVASALSTRLGTGGSAYRNASGNIPLATDTVPYGFYPRRVFEKIGMFDLEMTRNQDDEFNSRLVKAGGRIYLLPDLRVTYFARRTLKQLAQMMWQYGEYKPLVIYKNKRVSSIRQLIPPVVSIGVTLSIVLGVFSSTWLLLPVALYFCLCVMVSIYDYIESSDKSLLKMITMIVVFPVLHFSYGYGFVFGLMRVLLRPLVGMRIRELDTNR